MLLLEVAANINSLNWVKTSLDIESNRSQVEGLFTLELLPLYVLSVDMFPQFE